MNVIVSQIACSFNFRTQIEHANNIETIEASYCWPSDVGNPLVLHIIASLNSF